MGVLLEGPSGIGKSEIALELIRRGARLVADDVVRLAADAEDPARLVASACEVTRDFMEIRGVGLFRVSELYGEEAVASEVRVDLVCRLESWEEQKGRDRIGECDTTKRFGVELPLYHLPVPRVASPATLIELIARDQHWKNRAGSQDREHFAERIRRRA